MRVILDLHRDASGSWAAQAYDLPERTAPSTTLPCATADIAVDDGGEQRAGSMRLVLTELLTTPYLDRALRSGISTLYVYVYQPHDRAGIIAFEERIEPRYADYYAELGVFYAGLFDVGGLDGDAYAGEILGFERPLTEAKEFVATFEVAPDIERIEDECRALQRRDRPRHLVWLSR